MTTDQTDLLRPMTTEQVMEYISNPHDIPDIRGMIFKKLIEKGMKRKQVATAVRLTTARVKQLMERNTDAHEFANTLRQLAGWLDQAVDTKPKADKRHSRLLQKLRLILVGELPDYVEYQAPLWLESAYRLAACGLLKIEDGEIVQVRSSNTRLVMDHVNDCLLVFGPKSVREDLPIKTERKRKTDLLPCPFCGGKASRSNHKVDVEGKPRTYFMVRCDDEPCRANVGGVFESSRPNDLVAFELGKSIADKKWNTRKATPT